MTGRVKITNYDLESAKLYHRNRACDEAQRALEANNPQARRSHELLSALHQEAGSRLDDIVVLSPERVRLG